MWPTKTTNCQPNPLHGWIVILDTAFSLAHWAKNQITATRNSLCVSSYRKYSHNILLIFHHSRSDNWLPLSITLNVGVTWTPHLQLPEYMSCFPICKSTTLHCRFGEAIKSSRSSFVPWVLKVDLSFRLRYRTQYTTIGFDGWCCHLETIPFSVAMFIEICLNDTGLWLI